MKSESSDSNWQPYLQYPFIAIGKANTFWTNGQAEPILGRNTQGTSVLPKYHLFQIIEASGAQCNLSDGIASSSGNKTFVIRGTESAVVMAKDLMAAILGNDKGN